MSSYYELSARGEISISGVKHARVTHPGQPTVWLPMDECSGSAAAIKAKLAQRGMRLIGPKADERLFTELSNVSEFKAAPLIDRAGMNLPYFAMRNGMVTGPSGAPPMTAIFRRYPGSDASAGEAADWRDNVASLLTGQPLPMFLAALPLAAPVRAVLGIASAPIIELVGGPGSGIATAATIALSMTGNPAEGMVSFSDLMEQPDEMLDSYADRLMLVSDPHFALAATGATKAASQILSAVSAVSRDGRPTAGRAPGRVSCLILGSAPLIELVGAGTPVGRQVQQRVQTIDVRGRPLGIFSRLPDGVESASALTEAIQAATQTAHGAPFVEFTRRLVQDCSDDLPGLRARLLGSVRLARRKSRVDPMDGAALLRVDTFGLVYAASQLAKSYGILPEAWSLSRAVGASLRLAEKNLPVVRSIEEQLVEAAGGDNVIDLDRAKKVAPERIAAGMIFTRTRGGRGYLYVRPAAIEEVLPDFKRDQHRPEMARLWVRDADNAKPKRRITPNGQQERVYVFNLPTRGSTT